MITRAGNVMDMSLILWTNFIDTLCCEPGKLFDRQMLSLETVLDRKFVNKNMYDNVGHTIV